MFLRQAQAGSHTYLRLVENYREGDRVRQRVVLHLGRKDLLAPHLDSLVRVLQADDPASRWVGVGQLSTPQAWTWGPVPAASMPWPPGWRTSTSATRPGAAGRRSGRRGGG